MNVLEGITGYIQGAVAELRQVRWPTRHQAIRLSTIVLAFTLAAALVYGVVDFVLGRGIALLLEIA